MQKKENNSQNFKQQESPSLKIQTSTPPKDYWTQHRITLIAYEAQYVFSIKPTPTTQNQSYSNKRSRKKAQINYQSGFLLISDKPNEQLNVENLIRNFKNLSWLWNCCSDQNLLHVKQLINIALELKHSEIIDEFCEIYDIIVCSLKDLQFNKVQKQESRFKYLHQTQNSVIETIMRDPIKFPHISQYLRNHEKKTKKLIVVQIYCLLAELFNFNFNQFYCDSFASIKTERKPYKKVKKQ